MAKGYQSFTALGNIGLAPELRYTQSGTPLLSLRLAVGTDRKVDGEWTEVTEWFSAVVWGSRAESLGKILSKGDRIMCIGHLENREWEKDGVKRLSMEFVVREVVLCGGPRGGTPRNNPPASQSGGSGGGDFGDGDIPFAF